ncbi:MAG: lysophospholipid acyltransferase family protein [Rhodospirillales bacterium]
MIVLRSLVFNAGFFGWTGLLLVCGLPLLAADRAALRRLGSVWARGVRWMLRRIVGVEFEWRGPQLTGPRLVAAKHQSALDTMIFFLMADDPAYVMKKELASIPIYGRFARHQRMIFVDRAGRAGALKAMVADARSACEAGRQVVIFPQGTRTEPGAPSGDAPYQPGIAALQQALEMPTTPVALNSGLVWGRRHFLKRPGRIVVEVLPDLPAGLKRAEFMRRLEESIETATARLEAEARAGRTS